MRSGYKSKSILRKRQPNNHFHAFSPDGFDFLVVPQSFVAANGKFDVCRGDIERRSDFVGDSGGDFADGGFLEFTTKPKIFSASRFA